MDYTKKDLKIVMVLAIIVILTILGLAIWNNNTNILDDLATKLF